LSNRLIRSCEATMNVRARGQKIREFILQQVAEHPADLTRLVAEHFGVSRQAANQHLQRLVAEQALVTTGNTRNRRYRLRPQEVWFREYPITPELAEDVVWRNDIVPVLGQLPANVREIWQYAFTEMFNNVIDHAEGTRVRVWIEKSAADTALTIFDNGVGIFHKIQSRLGLLDERHAVLELSKGKLTTDPARHTGEGIFFSSRMFDDFGILSGETYFSHKFGDDQDWILQREKFDSGTMVSMRLNNHTARTTRTVFRQFSSGDEFGFTKTVVPVRLAQYGEEQLVSRSQAKRLLARVDRFRTVLFDFDGVASVGQAFTDEIFRVFAAAHPELELLPINANEAVTQMIARATAERAT
jgi:STAS-like domain of unknown function (DUF4325)